MRIYSTPLGGPLAWTQFPGTGLSVPWEPARLVVDAQGTPVLSVENVNTNAGDLRYYDESAKMWKPAAIAGGSSVFAKTSPRIVCAANGTILASVADDIYASIDRGHSYTLLSRVRDFMAAPGPLPPGGPAVDFPTYGTNAPIASYSSGSTLALNRLPWGEIMIGAEGTTQWRSLDDGQTWEHVDPLHYVPIRDMSGVPLYQSPHRADFCLNGNNAGSGAAKDADVLVSCDQNGGANINRITTTGLLVPLDNGALDLPYTTGTPPARNNLGQINAFHALRSGETLSSPAPWDPSNGWPTPIGRGDTEIVRWDGTSLSFATPPLSAGWSAYEGDGAMGATDGVVYYALSAATSNNLVRYTPAPAANLRPDSRTPKPIGAITMPAGGVATLQARFPATRVVDEGIYVEDRGV
jgi:hypothetical protein